jgi:hypothetical protein
MTTGGTNVTILKIFSPKKIGEKNGEKMAFFKQNTLRKKKRSQL